MAKETATYETMMVLSLANGEDNVQTLLTKFKDLIEAHGTIESVDEWGKRRLAYPINKEADGYYAVITFTSNPDFPAELDRVYHITDGVLRTIITVK